MITERSDPETVDGAETADDRDRARRRFRRRAARIERREREEALARLAAQGGLTDAQRETVRALAERLARDLTADAVAALDGGVGGESDPEPRAVARLFDVAEE